MQGEVIQGTALGIDIGGSGIKGAPVDLATGNLLAERFRIETPQPAVPKAVAETVGRVAAHFDWSGPVGVTFPGVVTHGVVHTAANLHPDWIGVDAAKLFAPALDLDQHEQVHVLNDADAAGLAEIAHGAGRGQSGVVILLTFGTGIGSALFLDGKLVPNTELGHLQVRGKDAEHRASAKVKEDKDLSWGAWGGAEAQAPSSAQAAAPAAALAARAKVRGRGLDRGLFRGPVWGLFPLVARGSAEGFGAPAR